MSPSIFLGRTQIALGIAAVALLTACGGGTSGGSNVTTPPAVTQQAPDLSANAGQSVQNALEDAASGMSLANSLDAGSVSSSIARQTASIALSATPSCVTASPQPPVDANNNGIPDNETYTLTNCTQQRAGGRTATLNGTYTIVDNSQPGAPLTWTRAVPNMTIAITSSSFNGSDVRNGQGVHTLVSPTQETIVRAFTNNWNAGSANAWTAVNSENITFNSSGATIVPLQAPPSGTITFTGTHQVTQGSTSVNYAVTTPGNGLTYDSTCATLPRITAGSVVLTPQSGGSVITVTFTGCGQPPTITKS